jgi:hypothetical protein
MSLSALISPITSIIDKLIPDKEAAAQAKIRLVELDQQGGLAELHGAVSIITAEASGESWLQRNWRPLTMVTFTGLIVLHWLGFTAENLPEDQIPMLLDIVKVGLGGYVVGRSAEKVMKAYKS